MIKPTKSMSQQVAQAAHVFQRDRTGLAPTAVTVVLSADTLVVTLHGTLSPAERALARTPFGAEHVQEFHRRLFQTTADSLRKKIHRITGVSVREAAAEVETTTGGVIHAFTSGTMVLVFQLARCISAEAWNEELPEDGSLEEKSGRLAR